MGTDTAGYREFVTARLEGLRRTAFLLCGDWHTADDLMSTALVTLPRHRRRVAAIKQPERQTLPNGTRRPLRRAWTGWRPLP